MRHVRAALARLAAVFGRRRPEDDFREEMEFHLEMQTARLMNRGMSREEARRQALLESGGLTQAAEAVHDQRGLPWMENIGADFRYAFRALRRSPAFTIIVVITLALGIGANTAIFSVVRGVLLKPLPHREGDRLVYVRQSSDAPGGQDMNFSVPEVRDLRNGVPSLAGIAEYSPWSMIWQTDEGATRISAGLVTGNYFEVMGLAPVVGRVTQPSDDGPGAARVMVLSHDFWMRRFGGDSTIVGRQLMLDRKWVTVIGVLQPAPFFPNRVDVLLNMVNSEHHLSAMMVEGRTHRMTQVVARMRPGATLEQTRAELDAVYGRLQREYPEAYDPAINPRVAMMPFSEVLGERARLTLWLLMGAAAFVLIISVANVANLTLMRGVRRGHELVVRAALGAGVARLRRLLLVENMVLAVTGAALGVLLAVAGVRLLTSLAERYSPRASEIRLDATVLAYTLVLSLGVAVMLSLLASVPREGRFASPLLAGAQRVSGSLRKHRLQRALVVVQVAVSVILLAGAGLLTRTMLRLAEVDTGLHAEEVLTMQVALLTPSELLFDPRADIAAKERYEQMRREVAMLPGVIEVGVGSPMPLRSGDVRFEVKVEGREIRPGETLPRAELRTADPSFFRAAGIPLLQGRGFGPMDRVNTEKVVIINRFLADRLFPGEDPVGRRIAWTGDILRFTPISGDWRTIAGVSGNTLDGGLDAQPAAVVYLPFSQMLALGGGLVIRADSNASALIPAATKIVRQIAPTAPIENVMTYSQYRDRSISPRRLNAVLISSFGALAVIVAAVGIAGVLAFSVSARTNEIGIRMSLGADPGRVLRMILGEGGVLLGAGLVLGVAGAWLAAGVIRGLLFGVAPHDPATFAGVAVMMTLIGLAACWIPARRAARIDPAVAMRT